MMNPQIIKRVSRELTQLSKECPDGISVIQISADNFREYVVNIRILEGPYVGSIAHCLLRLSDKHPQTAPYMNIFLGGGFEKSGHHHLIDQNTHIGFCIDMLSDSVMEAQNAGTGWNPAYTISALLVQMQAFIADPDRHGAQIEQSALNQFKKQNIAQKREFTINGETVEHTFDRPFPPFKVDSLSTNNPIIQSQISQQINIDLNFDIDLDSILADNLIVEHLPENQQVFREIMAIQEGFTEENQNLVAKEQLSPSENSELKESVTCTEEKKENGEIPEHSENVSRDENLIKQYIQCYITLQNAVDDPETMFGIPILVSLDDRFRHKAVPLTEFISHEGFCSLLESKNVTHLPVLKHPKKEFMFKGSSGGEFNYWLPIYMSDDHFKRNQNLIERCIANIAGNVHLPFQSSMVLDVIPNLMNAMFVKIFGSENGKISYFAIQAYVQLYKLLDRFCQCYSSLQERIDKMVIDFVRSDFNRNKNVVGDMGSFFVILNASSFDYQYTAFLDLLYREQTARQMMWMENDEEFMLEYSKESNHDKIMDIVWQRNTIGHNLLIFTIEGSKYLTSPQFLSRIESNSFVVSENYAKAFVHHTRRVREMMKGHQDLLKYFGLAHKYDSHGKVRDIFEIAIFVSNAQGYTSRKMTQAEKEVKPKLAHLSVNDDRIHSLPIKNKTDSSSNQGILPLNYEILQLEDVCVKGDCNQQGQPRQQIDFIDNSMVRKEQEARQIIFGKQNIKLVAFKDQPQEAVKATQAQLNAPLPSNEKKDKSQISFEQNERKFLQSDWARQKLGFNSQPVREIKLISTQKPKLNDAKPKKGEVNTFYNYQKVKAPALTLASLQQGMQSQLPIGQSWRTRTENQLQVSLIQSEQQL